MLGVLLEMHDILGRLEHNEQTINEAGVDDYRRLEIEPLDIDRFVRVNECKEITNPIIFYHGNRPTQDGLLSESIFGITTEERAGIYGYINLSEQFIHPFFYKIWLKLDKNLRACIYETDNFRLDKDGYLVLDPNGENGLPFLIKNQARLGFKNTKKTDMLTALLKARKEGWLFVDKLLVIPPYYRDIDTKGSGKIGVGEVNKLYMSVINTVRALRDATDYGFESKGPSRGRVQDLLMEVYNWFTVGESVIGGEHTGSGIFKKFGVMRRSVMSKTTDNSARLVISAPKINVESRKDFITDLDHGSLPLSAACATLYPFMIYQLNRIFNNEFNGRRLYPWAHKNGTVEYVELDNPILQFSDDRFDAEMNEFIHGYGNRFKMITVTTKDGREMPLGFKGYHITEEEYAQGKRESANVIERPMTWVDVLFMAANAANEGKHYIVTRYPVKTICGLIW